MLPIFDNLKENENCDQSYLTKNKTKKKLLKSQIIFWGIGAFLIKMTRDVQVVHSEYSRTGNDLKIKFLSNTKRMIAPGDILSFRLTL